MTTLPAAAQTRLVHALNRSGLLAEDLDYHIVRASMVIMFFFFGYQKWFPYEFERLVPFISNGPLIWWLYPAFGHAGASYFLGASEWTFGSLLLAGFWDKRLGVLGALGSTGTFIATVTIIPFMPEGWDVAAGGFPAMTGNVPFLMKDLVLLAVSFYLLRQDLVRLVRPYMEISNQFRAVEGLSVSPERKGKTVKKASGTTVHLVGIEASLAGGQLRLTKIRMKVADILGRNGEGIVRGDISINLQPAAALMTRNSPAGRT